MPRCSDCGDEYRPEDETRLNGIPMGLCIPCAEDNLHPTIDVPFWED